MAADASADVWCNSGTSSLTHCIQSGSTTALRLMLIMSRRASSLSGAELQQILSCCTGIGHVHDAQEPDGMTWQQAAAAPPCLMFCCRAPLVDLAAIDFLVRVCKPWVVNNVSKQKRNKNLASIAGVREAVSGTSAAHALGAAPRGTCAGMLSVLLDDVLLHYRCGGDADDVGASMPVMRTSVMVAAFS